MNSLCEGARSCDRAASPRGPTRVSLSLGSGWMAATMLLLLCAAARASARTITGSHVVAGASISRAAIAPTLTHRRSASKASSSRRTAKVVMDAANKPTRTRFAPSPTGSLHVGGARTALFSWLKAKQDGGKFLVRVEDTDTARSTRESEQSVLQDLNWLGLIQDEGPEAGGDKGPYRQSERMESGLYQGLAQKLLESGHAYRCFCTAEELEEKRMAAEEAGENPKYDGTWRDADPDEVQRRLDAGEPFTVRFKVPKGKTVTIDDLVRGDVSWDVEATIGDFILLRSGGMPVYNFCVAVDDALMEVSTVIRAEEHLTNTVRQALILEALGYELPQYAHLSLVLGEDRSKLSKRHGATSVDQFRREGFLPQAMINYLCLLGWNDSTDQEIYTVEELLGAFSLDRITKSPAVFDVKKLRWVNGQHLRALDEATRRTLVGAHLHEIGIATQAESPFVEAASLMVAEKVELVNDAGALVRDALAYPLAEMPEKEIGDAGFVEVAQALIAAHKAGEIPAAGTADFAAEWKACVKDLGKKLGKKGKQLQVLALAKEHSSAELVSFEDRMLALEGALSKVPVA